MDTTSLEGKTALVTGASSGIGRETARGLARRGARVILACRNVVKGEQTRVEIINDTTNQNVHLKIVDLSSLKSVRRLADDLNENESRLDLLVNNAGVYTRERQETDDGFEMHFATNHLGHFLLTYLLLPKLKHSGASRVVTVSSMGHRFGRLDFDDLQVTRKWTPLKAYARSKAANILFSTYLAQVLQGTSVTSYSLHPGVIETELARDFHNDCFISCFNCIWRCFRGRFLTPEEGARTTLYCCLEPSLATHTGRYYSDCRETRTSSAVINDKAAETLWNISAKLCGVDPDPHF